MLLRVFSLFDSKTGAYMAPFFMLSRGQALRSFMELVEDKSHSVGKYPADFTLFELGEFDDSCARFDLHNSPHSLGIGIELVRSQTENV